MDDPNDPLMWHTGGVNVQISEALFKEWYGQDGVSESAQEEALDMAFNADEGRDNEDSDEEDARRSRVRACWRHAPPHPPSLPNSQSHTQHARANTSCTSQRRGAVRARSR